MNNISTERLLELAKISNIYTAPLIEPYNSPIEPLYHQFIYLLMQEIKPDLVVELGTGAVGKSTAHFAVGYPQAKIIGIDHNPPIDFPFSNVEFWAADTRDCAPRVEKLNMPIDILFIDSTHESDHALVEYNAYYPLMRKGGIILWDDIFMGGMVRGWNLIPDPKMILPNLHDTLGFGAKIV